MPPLSRSSRSILFRGNAGHFPGDSLFDRIARAVCEAECLPRKELYEAWETALRIRRHLRGGPVVELAAGHGLLAMILLILDDTTPSALCVDLHQPPRHRTLLAVMERHWPRLQGRIAYAQDGLENAAIPPDALVASVHACGALTDRVLDLAIAGGHRVAVLPCCHDLQTCDTGSLDGWMDGPLAVDATRAARLRQAGYTVKTARIPADVTPKNRLLLGWPAESD
ncbi:MAG: methyltransferase [Candidatus Krumholzibacteriia bacterium]